MAEQRRITMQTKVFLDASYAIALSSASDSFHHAAIRLADELEAAKRQVVTTRAVMLEIGNALAKRRYRRAAVELLGALAADPDVEILPLSEDLYERAFMLYQGRPDKEWGLTDCVSFLVMRDRGISEALTADQHFQPAGFQALLREAT